MAQIFSKPFVARTTISFRTIRNQFRRGNTRVDRQVMGSELIAEKIQKKTVVRFFSKWLPTDIMGQYEEGKISYKKIWEKNVMGKMKNHPNVHRHGVSVRMRSTSTSLFSRWTHILSYFFLTSSSNCLICLKYFVLSYSSWNKFYFLINRTALFSFSIGN